MILTHACNGRAASPRRVGLAWAALSLACGLGAAGAEPGVPEYAAGFALFDKIGAPNVARATYVSVHGAWSIGVRNILPYDYETSGNAWLLAESHDAGGRVVSGTFVINGGEIIELQRRADGAAYDPDEAPAAPTGDWTPANLARDVRRVARFFRDLDREPFPDRALDDDTRARLFLFAQQLPGAALRSVTAEQAVTQRRHRPFVNHVGQRAAAAEQHEQVIADHAGLEPFLKKIIPALTGFLGHGS